MICGLKLTHDGAVALIDHGRLVCSTEVEKVGNRTRHSAIEESSLILAALAANGAGLADVGRFVIDGWSRDADGRSLVELVDEGERQAVDVAEYKDDPGSPDDPILRCRRGSVRLGGSSVAFHSYTHATDHVFASYCTSPFSAEGQPALVLVWDGGMVATLYAFDPGRPALRMVRNMLGVTGGLYPIFAAHFEPFRIERTARVAGEILGMQALLPVSGKAMAYAALEPPCQDAVDLMEGVTADLLPISGLVRSYRWSALTLAALRPLALSDAAILASFELHLLRLLLDAFRTTLTAHPELDGLPLCLSGGCALNIKWNTGLRASGLFPDVWVPPFPNDAGSAIGAACAEMVRSTTRSQLEWSVFSGPEVAAPGAPIRGWTARPCPIEDVAEVLHRTDEPVVVLNGRAELGPRALGHRSIVAQATSHTMQDRLNRMKRREWYRPVAPICLEERAPEVFSPGTRDPYMLFDHDVRPAWRDRIPAVIHVDGTARVQTVDADNDELYRLLRSYDRLSGIPVLCNTSANLPGKGFFPDATSVMRWGEVHYVWCDGTLFADACGRVQR